MPNLLAAAPPPVLTDQVAAEASRDRTEDHLSEVVGKAMRTYLAKVQRELNRRLRTGQSVIVAAGWEDPITLGELAGWWAEAVRDELIDAILSEWRNAYTGRGQPLPDTAIAAAVQEYLPRVTDRLVRGEVWIGGRPAPQVAEDTFDKARLVLARGEAEGWTKRRIADRFALEFGWETNGPAWRDQLDQVNADIDAILDPLGPPGNPAREYARLNDPTVALLQQDRADIIKALDAEKSHWEARAELIARTESTSLHGYAANKALAAEGFTHKKWAATSDKRTRPEHAEANGQTVPVDDEFIVGGYTMQYPGDPAAPVGMIANCRCTITGVDQQPEPEPVQEQPVEEWANDDAINRAEEIRREQYDAWYQDILADRDARASWTHYIGNGYQDMNDLLRLRYTGNKEKLVAEYITDLDKVFTTRSVTMNADTYVQRSIFTGNTWNPAEVFTPGTNVMEPGFLSTTTDPLLYGSRPGGDLWRMNILARKGTKAIYGSGPESEIIFNRGSVMRVLKIDEEANQIWVELLT